jgi:hypothetical protein
MPADQTTKQPQAQHVNLSAAALVLKQIGTAEASRKAASKIISFINVIHQCCQW